jgi:polyferredoxin
MTGRASPTLQKSPRFESKLLIKALFFSFFSLFSLALLAPWRFNFLTFSEDFAPCP